MVKTCIDWTDPCNEILTTENESLINSKPLILTRAKTHCKYIHLRERVKTILLEQEPPYHKKDGGLCLYPPPSTYKDGVLV